jgi:hypothetical protein
MTTEINQSNRNKVKAQPLFKAAGIAVIILGGIHICATPVIFGLFKENMKVDPATLYMFIMVGISTLFIGWLQYFLIRLLHQEENPARNIFRKILLVTTIFLCIMGSGAVFAMPDNPFAYVCLLIAAVELIFWQRFVEAIHSTPIAD